MRMDAVAATASAPWPVAHGVHASWLPFACAPRRSIANAHDYSVWSVDRTAATKSASTSPILSVRATMRPSPSSRTRAAE